MNNTTFRRGIAVIAIIVVTSALLTATGVGMPTSEGAADLQNQTVGQAQSGANISQQNGSTSTATVVFANQTSNGSTVTVQSVTLSQPGFVAIHTGGYATGPAPAVYSVIAVSDRLSAGTHRNVTIDISNAPAGNAPGLNRSRLNSSETLAAVVYRDSNGNGRFDFVRSFGEDDSAFTNDGSVISDVAQVRVPTATEAPQTASVVFENQTIQNNTLVVARARLPRGGFLVAHDARYRQSGDAVTSAIGLSEYLPPGNHTNVTINVLPRALNRTQIVTIRPALDTNNNQRYDFVRTSGFQDVAYENRTGNRSQVVTDAALVRVPGSNYQQATPTTRTPFPNSPTLTETVTETATAARPPTTTTTTTAGGERSSGVFDSIGLTTIVVVIGVFTLLTVLLYFIQKSR